MKEIDKKLLFQAESSKKAAYRNCNKPNAQTRTFGGPCSDKASVSNYSQLNSTNKSTADINESAMSREAESVEGTKKDFRRKTRE